MVQSNVEAVFTEVRSRRSYLNNIMKTADKEEGGFGKAPKFPQTFTIQYLLALLSIILKMGRLRAGLSSVWIK